ncbi:MAG TPA: hypothetical protein VKF59_18885 [Candidatus Dormibacteraeota bacterium]|nr:hypothetical protein [Candidatus Dormibacteraeota bacterium]
MVTTRIQTTRRRIGTGRHAHSTRRRLAGWSQPAGLAGAPAARRLSSFARTYAAAGALLVVAIGYLAVASQATQTSYELDRLKDQNAQLLAEQDQLRYEDARAHTSAGVAQAAAAAGLEHGTRARYVTYQPVALDLGAPVGPARPPEAAPWQRVLAALTGAGPAGEARAAG